MHRLEGLQTLRAVAALMVLVGHVIAEAEHYSGRDLPGDLVPWTRGVDLFFVISGFIVTRSAGRFAGHPAGFLKRRLMRVVPLYYLFTTLMVAALLLVPGGAKDTVLEPGQIISSYLFVPFERHDGRIAPVLSLGWTLNYEIFFYLVMAMALVFRRPYLMLFAVLIGLSLLGLGRPDSAALVFYTNPLILEFLFGVTLALVAERADWRRSVWLAGAGVAGGFALLCVLDQSGLPRFVAAGLPAALMVGGATLVCPVRRMPLQLLGDASYALYLSHRFVLRLLTLVALPLLGQTGIGLAVYVALCISACLGMSVLVHLSIERPLMNWAGTPANRRLAA